MAPNRGDTLSKDERLKEEQEEDHASSDADSFKSFEPEPDSPAPKTQEPPSTQNPSSDEPNTTTSEPPSNPPKTPLAHDQPRFPPEEEASLLADSNASKTRANALFGAGSHENAIQAYDAALALCPNYLDYEIAVLRANLAACHLKLEAWEAGAEAAGKGIECLERLEKLPEVRTGAKGQEGKVDEDVVEEVDEEAEARIENLCQSGRSLAEVRKLQAKLLLRRAKAKSAQGGWANLQAADEDYRVVLSPVMEAALAPIDRRNAVESARALGPRLNEAKDNEMAEMMGKLKGLGNSFLKPFGLSTENFKFTQDEKTGGYSMNFEQNPGGK